MRKNGDEEKMKQDSDENLEVVQEEKTEAEENGKAEPKEAEKSHEEKSKDYFDQLLRLQAEFANYRKRTEKEKTEAIRFGREIIIERMISLEDVMEQALKHSENATDIKSLKTGFQMVSDEFLRFLRSEGAEPLKTVGELFDPHLHEALEKIETDNEEDHNKIVEEIQKGYRVNGRLLRPAKVKVLSCKTKNGNGEEK